MQPWSGCTSSLTATAEAPEPAFNRFTPEEGATFDRILTVMLRDGGMGMIGDDDLAAFVACQEKLIA